MFTFSMNAFGQAELTIKMTPTVIINGPMGEYQIQRAQFLGNVTNWITITNITLSQNPFIFYDNTAGNTEQYYQAIQITHSANPNPELYVWIPPGTFTMGSPLTEVGRWERDGPQTQVTIKQGFWISKYEVTQKEYLNVMGTNPSSFTGDLMRPVEQVNWADATNYCGKLTQQERALGRLPFGYVYRLPTEAEWEYACRAGTTTATAFGNSLSSTQANFEGTHPYNGAAIGPSIGKTSVAGSYSSNPWGLYDMHGNVWEWCLDWWSDALPGGSVSDPEGPSSGSYRVSRGGCWSNSGNYCRSGLRNYYTIEFKSFYLGFRPVLASCQ